MGQQQSSAHYICPKNSSCSQSSTSKEKPVEGGWHICAAKGAQRYSCALQWNPELTGALCSPYSSSSFIPILSLIPGHTLPPPPVLALAPHISKSLFPLHPCLALYLSPLSFLLPCLLSQILPHTTPTSLWRQDLEAKIKLHSNPLHVYKQLIQPDMFWLPQTSLDVSDSSHSEGRHWTHKRKALWIFHTRCLTTRGIAVSLTNL